MDLQKFVSLLDRRGLFFTRFSKFSDPYEGNLSVYNSKRRGEQYEDLKTKIPDEEQFRKFTKDWPVIHEAHKRRLDNALVSSWHLNDYESAAMWDLYSQRNAGVAIQSTYTRLSRSLETNLEDEVFIGRVIYIDVADQLGRIYTPDEELVRKRISFRHEQELRAVTFLPEQDSVIPNQLADNGKYVSVDLEILIEKIYLAPKAPCYFYDGVKSIVERFDIDKELLVISDLYSLK